MMAKSLNNGLLILVILTLAACSTTPPQPVTQTPHIPLNVIPKTPKPQAPAPSVITKQLPTSPLFSDKEHTYAQLMAQYKEWHGVRHRLGGESKKGIDCSGFVQMTYRDRFGIKLPRSTSYQAREGQTIDKSKLTIGDLVFFRINRSLNHVGIYLGKNRFLHVSTKQGVMISELDDKYWSGRYWKAVRLDSNS